MNRTGARVILYVMGGFAVIVKLSAASALVMAQDTPNSTLIRGEKITGEKIVELPVPGRKAEICVVPKLFDGAGYSAKDARVMEQLCAIDVRKNAAVCPKLNSTNPGLDIFAIPPGTTAQKFQDTGCKSPKGEKIAKYKLSTSCSYTPSILGYYHVSRILGHVANVPPAVLRTYDLADQIALGHKALVRAPASSLIHATWVSLMAQLTAGPDASRRALLLTDDFSQSYGALMDNPSHEEFYKDFFNGGSNNVARAQNFRDRNPAMAMLASGADVSTMVGRSFTVSNVQKMVQLKDASELVVLDTLLNQQDRFGNIHDLPAYYYLDAQDGKIKNERKLTPGEVVQRKAVKVKQMMLKDNDCGVAKTNVAKSAGLADRIAHMDPETYYRLLSFDQMADRPEVEEFFRRETLFTAADFASLRANLKQLASQLHQRCTAGRLKLDLDLDIHFSEKPLPLRSCQERS
ncbi:MAG TPA: hypothetical protein VIU43_02515 [Nitrosospira sp.]